MEKSQQLSRPFSVARLVLPLLWIAAGVILGSLIPKRSTEKPARTAEAKPIQAAATSTRDKNPTENLLGPPAPALSALDRLRAACTNNSFGAVDISEALTAIQQLTFSEMHPALALI